MNEFIGLVMYPFRFSTSARRSSSDLLTHATMSLSPTSMSLVNSLRGASSFGVLLLTALFDFDFLGLDFVTRALL